MSPADKTKPLVPYLRQSRKKEQTITFKDQWKAISDWAKDRDVPLLVSSLSATEAAGLVERGVSGAKDWRKREVGKAIAAIQNGEASGIIVAYQDRLARPTWLQEAEVWEALADADGRLVCAAEGTDFKPGDPGASDARALYRMKAVFARWQWERHQRNWKNGKHAAWERGAYVADLPSGYGRAADGGLVPNGAAETIRRAFELRAAEPRASWSEIAGVLRDAGVETRFGSTNWSPAGLRGLIGNETYSGLHRCSCGCEESVVREEWEVVPGWLWRKAQSVPDASYHRVRGEGHALGQGLVRCGTCGAGLTRSMGSHGSNLRCPTQGTGHVSILYEPALEWILLEAVRYIGVMKLDDGNEAERAKAEQAVADARAALAEIEAMLGTSAPAGSKQRVAVQEAEDALAGLDRTDGTFRLDLILTPLGVKQHIESLPVAEQRRVLRSVIEKVVLSKPAEGHSSRDTLLASQRGTARDRLTVYFADGSVSPAEHDWSVLAPRFEVEEVAG